MKNTQHTAKKLLWLPSEQELDFSKYTAQEIRKLLSKRNYIKSPVIEPEISATVFYLMANSVSLRNLFLKYEHERIYNNYFANANEVTFSKNLSRLARAVGINIAYMTDTVAVSFKDAVLNLIDVPKGFTLKKGVLIANRLKTDTRRLAYEVVYNAYKNIIESIVNTRITEILRTYSNPITNAVLKMYMRNSGEVRTIRKPPCIEKIEQGDIAIGERNNALFALINYYKWRKLYIERNYNLAEIEEIVRNTNAKFPEPLPEKEVNNLIKYHLYGSRANTIYSYCGVIRRNIPRLCPFKDRNECRQYLKNTTKTTTPENNNHNTENQQPQ